MVKDVVAGVAAGLTMEQRALEQDADEKGLGLCDPAHSLFCEGIGEPLLVRWMAMLAE